MSDLLRLLGGDVAAAARGLLGRTLISEIEGASSAVVLTEVEAYGGEDDPASHSFRGRTARNAAMFGPPGMLYVYRSYGIHWCLNAVTGPEGRGSAVLLRGGIPIGGIEQMEQRRGRSDHVADGPGRLAQALGVTGDHNGASLSVGPVRIEGVPARGKITVGPRVGISRATDRPWRFLLELV